MSRSRVQDRRGGHRRPIGTAALLAVFLGVAPGPAEEGRTGRAIETDRRRGELYEGSYHNGLREGVWRLRGARRKLIHEETFVGGVRDGAFIAYSVDGRVIAVVNYREGRRHGSARFYFGDGRSLLTTYEDGVETSRRLVGPDGGLLRTLPARATRPVVSSDNWDAFWTRMDEKAPKKYRDRPSGWSLRVVVSAFRAARRYINPHLMRDVEGDLFRDMLARFSRNVCRSAGKAWATVLRELGADVSEEDEGFLADTFCEFHARLSSFDYGLWDEEDEYYAGVYREFLAVLQERLSDENYALLAIFLESTNLTTRRGDSRG